MNFFFLKVVASIITEELHANQMYKQLNPTRNTL